MKYLDGYKWKEMTREERYFCCELYFLLKENPTAFIKWLDKRCNLGISEGDIKTNWEVAIEVCFYRDFIKRIGYKNIYSIGKTKFRKYAKRTFDICLFSEKYLIVIEAKAQQGFHKKQLESIDDDRVKLKSLLNKSCPEVIFIALCSSKYHLKQSTKEKFNNHVISWLNVSKFYNNKILSIADTIYND